MKNKLNQIIEKLIAEGQAHTFKNNSKPDSSNRNFYSNVSDDFIAWYSQVEAVIHENFSDTSPAFKAISSVNTNHFKGFEEWQFEKEILKIKNSLHLAKESKPDRNQKNFTSSILILLSNKYFWGTIICLIPGSFYFGKYIGETKYDERKIAMSKQIDTLNTKILFLQKELDNYSKRIAKSQQK
jgi:hypothetical protein